MLVGQANQSPVLDLGLHCNQSVDLQSTLNIPAIWSEAKDNTIRAAAKAGISRSRLFLLSEPEAGAVYAIHTIQMDNMAVSLDTSTKLSLRGLEKSRREQVSSSPTPSWPTLIQILGTICGSVILDARFEAFLALILVTDIKGYP